MGLWPTAIADNPRVADSNPAPASEANGFEIIRAAG